MAQACIFAVFSSIGIRLFYGPFSFYSTFFIIELWKGTIEWIEDVAFLAYCCPKNQLIFHLSNDWFLKWKPNQKSITKFTTSVDTLHLHHSNKGIVHVIIGTFNVCSFLELGIILNFGWLETVSDRKVVALSIALSFFHLVINATDFVLVNYITELKCNMLANTINETKKKF